MSEHEANERRTVGEGSISSLVHTAVNADASQEGTGPAGQETDPDVPAKDTAAQQADTSQEGQGPAGKPSDPDVPAKDTASQQADTSREGPGPAGKETDTDTEADRVNEIVQALKRVLSAEEAPEAGAGNLLAEQDARLMAFATAYAKGEARRAQKTGELERALAADERFVSAMIEESQSMKSREEAAGALRKIKALYWNKLVRHMENGLIDARNALDDELRNVRLDLSRRFQDLPDQIAPPLTLRQRIQREKPLLAAALVGGLALGSLFAITGETLWDNAAAAGREAIRLFSPALIPLVNGSGQ